MKTLLEQINEQDNQIYIIEAQLASMKAKLQELKDASACCKHEFVSPQPGHEGVVSTCRSCGIFESYVNTFNHMVQQAAKDK